MSDDRFRRGPPRPDAPGSGAPRARVPRREPPHEDAPRSAVRASRPPGPPRPPVRQPAPPSAPSASARHPVARPANPPPPPWSGRADRLAEHERAPHRPASDWSIRLVPALAVGGAVVLAAAIAAFLVMPSAPPEPSAADVISERFLAEWANAAPAEPTASPEPVDIGDRFAATHPGGVQVAVPTTPAEPASPAAPAPSNRIRNGNSLLNDAQIESLKERLKLTREQDQLWPPVEKALRAVVWKRPEGRRGGPASLDSRSLEQLKTAAAPLVAKLRDDQKRQVKTLAHVLGLSQLADQF